MKIAVVLVTYNRIGMLKKALESYKKQTYKPDLLVVVNNNSTDGTKEYLKDWKNSNSELNIVIKDLPANIGGSGGFYEGLQEATKHAFDWVWVADDDAFPEEKAFKELENFVNRIDSDLSQVAAIAGMVINTGQIDLNHRKRLIRKLTKVKMIVVEPEEYQKEFFEVDLISYVGTFIQRSILLKAGLTEKDYFIWFDDTEHSIRLRKQGKIYCVPAIKIEHNQTETTREITWKKYYGLRNKLLLTKKHFSYLVYLNLCFSYFAKSLTKSRKDDRKIYCAALHDGMKNRQGLHEVYKPGWKSHK